jgi:hypothetical protein
MLNYYLRSIIPPLRFNQICSQFVISTLAATSPKESCHSEPIGALCRV